MNSTLELQQLLDIMLILLFILTQPTPQNTVEREKAMRDYKLSIEYKHLKQHW